MAWASIALDRRQVLRAVLAAGACPWLPRSVLGSAVASGIVAADWAGGGTASMPDKATYPDPFTGGLDSCAIVAATTAGPCTTATDLEREDISEGWSGLPVRLGLRVVDSACQPIVGATVKIWHTNVEGGYSGQTPSNAFCLLDQSYADADFFRGVQTTDGDGVVYFDTCFPGWYRGRAIHIHFQVKDGNQSYRISQLFFPEDITAGIFSLHSEYSPYGQPDTVFSTDGIFAAIPAGQRDRLILDVAQMTDGAMLASKTVAVVQGSGQTATPSATSVAATPTPTLGGPVPCIGDCDDDGSITVAELIRGVNIALGRSDLSTCSGFDENANGSVAVSELIQAVNAALRGCKPG
jgi:protocatechuate 3,4-dioxygenase beta subunit